IIDLMPGVKWDSQHYPPLAEKTHVLLWAEVVANDGTVLHSREMEVVVGPTQDWNPCIDDPTKRQGCANGFRDRRSCEGAGFDVHRRRNLRPRIHGIRIEKGVSSTGCERVPRLAELRGSRLTGFKGRKCHRVAVSCRWRWAPSACRAPRR